MSIQAASCGSGTDWSAIRQQMQPRQINKDQLTQLDQKLKSEGKDTTNLDKIMSNFDQLDTDQSGTLTLGEIKSGAQQYGIQLPQGGHHHHHHGGSQEVQGGSQSLLGSGPPPGMFDSGGDHDGSSTKADASTQGGLASFIERLLQNYSKTDSSAAANNNTAASVSLAA